jgi:hypothetical protein
MNIPLVLCIGAIPGALGAAGIYFDTRVPGRNFIVAAGTLRGVLVGLLTGLSLSAHSGWLVATGFGALYGFLSGLVVCLAKGASAFEHAKYLLPSATVTGAVSGALLAWLAF